MSRSVLEIVLRLKKHQRRKATCESYILFFSDTNWIKRLLPVSLTLRLHAIWSLAHFCTLWSSSRCWAAYCISTFGATQACSSAKKITIIIILLRDCLGSAQFNLDPTKAALQHSNNNLVRQNLSDYDQTIDQMMLGVSSGVLRATVYLAVSARPTNPG